VQLLVWLAIYPGKDWASNNIYSCLQWLESLEGLQSKDSAIHYLVTLVPYNVSLLVTQVKGRITTAGRVSEITSQILKKVRYFNY
jgi:hypothetical protein